MVDTNNKNLSPKKQAQRERWQKELNRLKAKIDSVVEEDYGGYPADSDHRIETWFLGLRGLSEKQEKRYWELLELLDPMPPELLEKDT